MHGRLGPAVLQHFTGGKVLPCHAAESITGLEFESVRSNHSIAWIWRNSEAFNRYPVPLDEGAVQELRVEEIDFGGCRCQAFALTGDAAIPTRPARVAMHEQIFKQAELESAGDNNRFLYAISPVARWRRAATMRLTPMRENHP